MKLGHSCVFVCVCVRTHTHVCVCVSCDLRHRAGDRTNSTATERSQESRDIFEKLSVNQ